MSPKRDRRRPSKPVSVPRRRSQGASQPGQAAVPSPSYAGMPDMPAAAPQPGPKRSGLGGIMVFRWIGSWQFLLLTTLALITGTLAFAVTSLFRMPNLPNCRAIFWPTASAAMRLQCADSYATQGSVDFLLEAIGLVEKLPEDHPLRAEIDAKVETWSGQILELADDQFHQGELEDAIATAKKIPSNTAAADKVESSIRRWQRIWEEGADIFDQAKKSLVDGNFKDAFGLSVRLLDVSNDYWSETKYTELTKLIALAREDSRKLNKVKRLASNGTVSSFKEALKLLNSIKPESVLHGDAKEMKKTIAKDMLEVAEDFLARKKLSQAEEILAAIPKNEGLDREIADFQVFTDAYRHAWSGDALGLDSAVTRLQSMGKDRPLYSRAQTLIRQWRAEIKALAQLDKARQIAAPGNVNDLRSAIAQAQQVGRNNPRWQEVSTQITQWEDRVQTSEDLPILNKADQLAEMGTPQSLQLAIQEARRISPGRALTGDAQKRISRWQARIEAIEDRPLVDEARRLATAGDLAGAIAAASRISPERSLYGEIQNDLASWRDQQQNQTRLQEANNIARSGTANDLARAIVTANQIPSSSSQYGNALQQINRWSSDLLNIAEGESYSSLDRAISLANQIPSQANAYANAQSRIQAWRAEQQQAVDAIESIEQEAPPVFTEPSESTNTPANN
ncbi:chromosome segregation ATPase [Leptolyngbya cf. ectocarpi LEGE 11479]|uniref:Chromosome segregation ATPase n=1 Tax=Leptolyngbya cf. ectocarpi LEGE 11479 TaxID=1828722 RepID=A0A929F906_LEPEC|nr:chromosome segregation ATPase [Leptolyngbya ectocarpi]MBE9069590.1 chromosome segregation ATPase [Leptolyngbya cf. ectocarpi LEGE 11479]